MGVIHIKKKKGTSFLEIIIALSIIGIISAAVFNNIAFSLKVNKATNQKQTSSLLAQHVVEEIKNMSEGSFDNLAKSMIGEETTEELSNVFLGDEFEDIDKESVSGSMVDFLEGSENINSFKVFHKKGTELYVKVSLPKIKKGSLNKGLVNNYEAHDVDEVEQEWKDRENCKIAMEITKGLSENDYEVKIIDNKISTEIFQESKEKLIFKVNLDRSNLKMYYISDGINENEIHTKDISGVSKEVNVYIKDTTTEGLDYIIKNVSKIKPNGTIDETIGLNLNLYMEQKKTNKSKFISEGSNIRVYNKETDEGGVIIDGENIIIDSVCDFVVEVYKEDKNNKYNSMLEIKGHKKFKRFE